MKKLFLALLLLVSTVVFAEETTWKSDAAHSKALFTVSHMVINEVTGRFNDFDVTLVQTGSDFVGSKVTVTVKAASVNTDNEGRDKHLRSEDFFSADKFPEEKFVSTAFEKSGENTYKITGNLTLRGVTKQVVLDAKFNGKMKSPWGNEVAGFKVTGSVKRTDFGLVWNKTLDAGGLLVGENVDLTFQIELGKEKKEDAPKK